MVLKICFSLVLLLSTGCSLYKSPDRKDFESVFGNLNVNRLQLLQCSERSQTDQPVLTSFSNVESNEVILFRKISVSSSEVLYESDNLQGTYCVYQQR